MKTRILLLALSAYLLGGCAQTVTLTPSVALIHATQPSIISVALLNNGVAPVLPQSVAMETEAAAPFSTGGLTAKIRAASGAGSVTVVGGTVDRNTDVTIEGEWEVSGWNPSGSTVVTVLPPLFATPQLANGSYVLVTPSVKPNWTFRYEIQALNAGGGVPPDLTDFTFVFTVPTTLTVVSANNPLIGATTATATKTPGGSWIVAGAVVLDKLVVDVVVADGSPGGTATIICREKIPGGWNTFTLTPTGPQP